MIIAIVVISQQLVQCATWRVAGDDLIMGSPSPVAGLMMEISRPPLELGTKIQIWDALDRSAPFKVFASTLIDNKRGFFRAGLRQHSTDDYVRQKKISYVRSNQ
jgi:hypothetical protein